MHVVNILMFFLAVGHLPISLVQKDVVFSYMQGIELEINEMFSTYQQLCHARKVNTRFSLIEHDDVASAIIKQISSYGINELVIGSDTRRFRSHDVADTVLKNKPNFCTVHIAPKCKLSSALLTSSKELKIRYPEAFSNQSSGFSDMTNLATLKGMTESQSEGFIHDYSQSLQFQRIQSPPNNYQVPISLSASNPASTISNVESRSASIPMSRSQTSGIGGVYNSGTPRFSTSRSDFLGENSSITMSIEGRESPGNTGLPSSTPPLSIGNLPNSDMETYTFSTSGKPFNLDTASTDVLGGSLHGDPTIFSPSLGGDHGNVIDEMDISPWNVKTPLVSNNEQNMMMEVEALRFELKNTQSMLYALARQEATKANITANELTKEIGRQLAAEREGQQRRNAEIRARIDSQVRKKTQKAPESKQPYVQTRHIKEERDAMPPKHFLCPILEDIMDDPHMADDGYTYEYAFIRNWLENNNTSPMTKQPIQQNILIPNNTLRSAIQEWKIKSGFNNEDYDT